MFAQSPCNCCLCPTSPQNTTGFNKQNSRELATSELEQLPLYRFLQPNSPQTSSSCSTSSTSSGESGHLRNDEDSSDEMEEHAQSIKVLRSLEPEVHSMALPQVLPIAGDLPSHALPQVTSPSLGFGLPSSEVSFSTRAVVLNVVQKPFFLTGSVHMHSVETSIV